MVDKDDKLVGRLSLKDLIIAKSDQKIADISKDSVDSVNVNEDDEEIAKIMAKYDLEAIPVVDDNNVLVGRITIDDIVDVIRDEADKDYQMAAGFSQDVEANDTIWELTKARLPWLILALFGGFVSVSVLGSFDEAMEKYPELFFFTPLIAAMAGNVGVQSSAIIVQGLANDSLRGSLFRRLLKEILQGLLKRICFSSFINVCRNVISWFSFRFRNYSSCFFSFCNCNRVNYWYFYSNYFSKKRCRSCISNWSFYNHK